MKDLAGETTKVEEPQKLEESDKAEDMEAPIGQVDPFAEFRQQAQRLFDGDEELVDKATAAAWLGDSGPERTQVRKAYMELFDWTNLDILCSLRGFCGKLILKGETQQVDRVLDAFSTRWCECNPNHGFKATGENLYLRMPTWR